MSEVASLWATFGANTTSFEQGVNRVNSGMNQAANTVGGKVKNIGQSMGSLGAAFAPVAAGMTAFGAVGLKTASDFDSAMAEISARTQTTGKDLESIRQFALKMGADTSFSAQQSADAFLQLLSSGQDTKQAMATLPAVLDAAAASGMDLGMTADMVTDILSMYGLEAESASKVSNALAKAAGASSADIFSLGQGFGNVGGLARQFGLGVDETAAILALFSENGIKGAEAGTQLKSMLTNLTSDKATKTFKELGLSLYDVQGNARPLNTVFEELNAKLSGMSDQDRTRIIHDLAGSYGQLGLSALLANDGFDTMLGSMNNAAGASDVAKARMNTFAGAVDSLKGSVETLMITALTPLMNNVLKPMAQSTTTVINKVTDLATKFPKVTQAVAVGGLAFVLLTGALLAAPVVIAAVTAALGLLFSPIGAIAAAITLLYVAWSENFLGIQDLAASVWTEIDTRFVQPLKVFVDYFANSFKENGLVGMLNELFTATVDGQSSLEWLFNAFGLGAENSKKLADSINQFGLALMDTIMNDVLPAAQAFGNWFLSEGMPAIISFVTGTVLPTMQTLFNTVGQLALDSVVALIDFGTWFLNDGLPAIRDFIVNDAYPFIEVFFLMIKGAWELIEPELSKLYTWFVDDALPTILSFLENDATTAFNTFIDIIKGIWEVVEPPLSDLYNWFVEDALPVIMDFLDTDFSATWEAFKGLFLGLWNTVSGAMNSFKTGVLGVIQPIIDKLNEAKRLFDSVSNMSLPGGGGGGGSSIFSSIAKGVGSATGLSGAYGLATSLKKAGGGSVMANRPYMVGEREPELFVPSTAGRIYNQQQMQGLGGNSVTINGGINIQANSYSEGQQAARGFMDTMRARGIPVTVG